MYKKTNKKVEVTNGCRRYTRTVYVSCFGNEYFKDGGEWNLIYKKTVGTGYNAPYYNGVRYIEKED